MANRFAPSSNRALTKLRCAIYSRKSSEEGLEQDFNSLDAQREACAAFIASQKREGWILVGEMYDDGGFSGATMERPAFQRLLSDVSAGQIDVVVVYKVDRLTRSLSDFAKIVDIFDRHAVSFVSVTQQFNTTSSMGRLTLNILLSFAQFEREVTGERIRDKIAASKKKGMWMGGQPSLGYDDVKDRRLVINKTEAETVRHIFRRYTELRSVRELKEDLDAAGIVSKVRTACDGSRYGGQPIARGALYLMLQNRIYRGEIVHKGKSYPGEHEAIVDETLWNNVQAILSENRLDRANGVAGREGSLLTGILFDAQGGRMSPTHANKKGTRYRYYISRSLLEGSAKSKAEGQRIPAAALESFVVRRIRDWLADSAAILQAVQHVSDAATQKRLIERARDFAKQDHDQGIEGLRAFIRASTVRAQVHVDHIDIMLDQDRVCRCLDETATQSEPIEKTRPEANRRVTTLSIPARLKRTGKEMRIIVDNGSEPATPDTGLVRLLVRAHAIRDQLLADRSLTFEDIAKSEGVVSSYATRLFRLTILAPDIVSAILFGKHPPELTARGLMDDTRLPLDWSEQRRCLGFASAR
jgi:DNA invertase Pin-like site-specific DNA recombinase